MAGFSPLAETLGDYALSVAKRHGNESAGELHLLAAIRQWEQAQFDERFPESFDRVERLLATSTGDSLERPALDDSVRNHLQQVERSADAWELANVLLERLPPAPLNDGPAVAATARAATDLAEPESVDTPSVIIDDESPLLISRALAERISAAAGRAVEEVAALIASDALVVAGMVFGTEPPKEVAQEISSLLETSESAFDPRDEVSDLVGTIAHGDFEDGDRLGTELALALIDVGEWAAALDEQVTRDETDRIDDIRMFFRDQLGDRLRAENDAFHAFEAEFEQLVGMQGVKDELRKRVEFLLVAKRRSARGHRVEPQRSHMAFLGNPGTGKTTVARLYGKLLHDVGLLPSDNLVETDRSGLVGEYIGHSEKKTRDVVDSADGGVLFIDEAYALADHYGPDRKGFGAEATDVIVKLMEDRRDRLVVIVAGYSEPMQQFLSINPGLRSRIPALVEFPDYADEELVTIAERIAERRSLMLDPEAKAKIRAVMATERSVEGFGNAREVENLLDTAQRNIVARVSELGNLATSRESATVLPQDIPDATEPVVKRPFGFSSNNA